MCAKWRSNYQPDLIWEELKTIATVNKKGRVVFDAFAFHDRLWQILVSALEFAPGIPDVHKVAIVSSAVQDSIVRGKLTNDGVKDAVSREERRFLKLKIQDFVLATSISLREVPPFRSFPIDGSWIRFSRKLPLRFERDSATTRLATYLSAPIPEDYVAIRVEVAARSEESAAETALALLSYLMGIWNFLLTNRTTTMKIGGIVDEPIASVLLGPLHTVHRPDGKPATDTIWYEPTYSKPAPYGNQSKKLESIHKFYPRILRAISQSPDGARIRNGFMRYASALEEPNQETCFLRLWGVLELLTDTGKDSYDKTIRRASFIFKDYARARQELNHLRDVRNGIVHLGVSTHAPQTNNQRLKRYVDELIVFLLSKEITRLPRSEVNTLLDLSPEVVDLRRRRLLHSRAIRFRT